MHEWCLGFSWRFGQVSLAELGDETEKLTHAPSLYDVGALLEVTAPVVSAQKLTDGLAPLFLAAQPFPSSNPPPTLQHEFV